MEIKGTLPIAIKKLVGQTEVKSKKVVMRQMTAIEYLQSQASVQAGQFIAIADLSAMTKLIAEDGTEYDVTYDMLGHSSRTNLDYLNHLKEKLDAKEQAEHTTSEQKSSEH